MQKQALLISEKIKKLEKFHKALVASEQQLRARIKNWFRHLNNINEDLEGFEEQD